MIEKIILSVVACLMLFATFKKGNKKITIYTSGLTVGILLSWFNYSIVTHVGLIIYTCCTLILGITRLENQTRLIKMTIFTSCFFSILSSLFMVFHWPYHQIIYLSLVIPLGFYIIAVFQNLYKSKDFGYLTIINVELLFKLIP